jgi:trans-aconitate 2-methyltransferase
MSDWNPDLYRRFEDERTRPARELLARVPLAQAARVVDLGCGPGNSTELLVHRFPGADVVGTDNSPAMLQSARERLPGARFELGDIASWQPAQPPDLIYANASLQWVPDHRTLFPRLFSLLAPGGVLAVQMPDNHQEATHRAMRDVAALPAYAPAIGNPAQLRPGMLTLADYYDLLAPEAADIDVFHTVYQHRMESPAAIVEWVSGTGLKPFVAKLDEQQRAGYLAEYQRRIAQAYPVRADGKLLLAFPRLFIIARRKA